MEQKRTLRLEALPLEGSQLQLIYSQLTVG